MDRKPGPAQARRSGDAETEDTERTEPEGLNIHADALLLVDALERHDVTLLSIYMSLHKIRQCLK